MGWGAELLQGAFLIADDIMDEAEMRRGKPAWYRLEKVFPLFYPSKLDISTCEAAHSFCASF